jgi:hypothetical protein
MQKALDALEEHTQRQEQTVAQTALARARSAADVCVQMREERKLSQAGQSLWLQTMTYSYEQQKMGEAARMLGMGIGGMEATSALKVALTAPSDQIKVGGFESAASIKQLGAEGRAEDHRRRHHPRRRGQLHAQPGAPTGSTTCSSSTSRRTPSCATGCASSAPPAS